MKRALVMGAGMLRAGFDAGVSMTLARHFPKGFFQKIFVCSGSVFNAGFVAAGQPDPIENVWRHLVDRGQLVSWRKLLQGRKYLDLDGLIQHFVSGPNRMDPGLLFGEPFTEVVCVLTDYDTGRAVYAPLTRSNQWYVCRATCAVPLMYGPVFVPGYGLMIDGGLVDLLPVRKALAGDFDEVWVVNNRPPNHKVKRTEGVAYKAMTMSLPPHLRDLFHRLDEQWAETQKLFADPRVKLIQSPGKVQFRSPADDDHDRLNRLIDSGVEECRQFIASLRL